MDSRVPPHGHHPCIIGHGWALPSGWETMGEGAHIGVHVPGGSSQLLLGKDWKRQGYQTEPNTKATNTRKHGMVL